MKNIVITGANRGIGLGLSNAYAAAGASVVGVARRIPSDAPGVAWHEADVTDLAALRAVASEVPSPDLLICNAGVYLDRSVDLFDVDADEWADTFAVNVEGVFRTVQAFLPKLARGAKIAIISSQMGSSERARGGSYAYRASKAAATNLGRNLALDLAPKGISVGIYHPGWVRTDMGTEAADLGVSEAAQGLMERFEALGPETSGCFEAYDGAAIPL